MAAAAAAAASKEDEAVSKKRKMESAETDKKDIKSAEAPARHVYNPLRVAMGFPVGEIRQLAGWLRAIHTALPRDARVWNGLSEYSDNRDLKMTWKDAIFYCNEIYGIQSAAEDMYWKAGFVENADPTVTLVLFEAPLFWEENNKIRTTRKVEIGKGSDALSFTLESWFDLLAVRRSRYMIPFFEGDKYPERWKPERSVVISLKFTRFYTGQKVLCVKHAADSSLSPLWVLASEPSDSGGSSSGGCGVASSK